MNIELKPIAESKVRQLGGDVCGVLVRKDEKLAAVNEHGRVTWLRDRQGADLCRCIGSGNGCCCDRCDPSLEQAARSQGGEGVEVAADFRAEIRTERDPSDEYVSYLTLIADGKSHPYLHIPESLDQSVLDEALRRLNTQPQPAVPEWKELEALADEYVEGYEFRGDEGDYQPTERERFLIEDCVAGLMDEVHQILKLATLTTTQPAVEKLRCQQCGNMEPFHATGCETEYGNYATTPQADGWIRCEDRLPKHGQKVRTKGSDGRQFDCEYFHWEGCEKGYFKLLGKVWNHEAVIQWMPQPPKEDSGDEY